MISATRRFVLALPILLAPLCGFANPPVDPAEAWILQQMLRGDPARSLDSMRLYILAETIRDDLDGGGLSLRDSEIAWQKSRARRIAKRMAVLLSHDLDADGMLTRDEIATAARRPADLDTARATGDTPSDRARRQIDEERLLRSVEKIMAADTDRDGRITLAEMLADARADGAKGGTAPVRQSSVFNAFDLDRDGNASVSEIDIVVQRVLTRFDTDGDQRYSPQEILAAGSAVSSESQAAMRAAQLDRRAAMWVEAGLPPIDAAARLVVVNRNAIANWSTAGFGSSETVGQVTSVADVLIEPGSELLTLIVAAQHRTIWRLSGDVARVAQVVALGSGGGSASEVGVIGVPREKVAIPSCARCVIDILRRAMIHDPGQLAAVIGRKPDRILASSARRTLFVPSGRVDSAASPSGRIHLPETGPAAIVWREAEAKGPRNIIHIDPESVVADRPVATHKVLPGLYGLAQLVEDGALEIVETDMEQVVGRNTLSRRNSTAESSLTKVRQLEVARTFRITRKVTLPKTKGKRFLLPVGVPEPGGHLSGATLIRE